MCCWLSKGLDADLRSKGGASDLVQQTFVEPPQDFARFQGRSRREPRNWLVGVLHHNLADFRRRYRDRAARQVTREEPLSGVARCALCDRLAVDSPSPVVAKEDQVIAEELGRKPQVPRWRAVHEDGSPFPGETHPPMVTLRTAQPGARFRFTTRSRSGVTWAPGNRGRRTTSPT
jgi:hypothetical protein